MAQARTQDRSVVGTLADEIIPSNPRVYAALPRGTVAHFYFPLRFLSSGLERVF